MSDRILDEKMDLESSKPLGFVPFAHLQTTGWLVVAFRLALRVGSKVFVALRP